MPPRVNVSIGGGKGGTSKSGNKRTRDDDDDGEELSMAEGVDGEEDEEQPRVRDQARRQGKQRRVETFGQKKVDKEVYRNKQKAGGGGEQWSR